MFAPRSSKAQTQAAAGASGSGSLERALPGKLTVGRSDHPLEHEADRIADQAIRMPEPALSSARASAGGPTRDIKERRSEGASRRKQPSDTLEVPPTVTEALSGPGHPLDSMTKAFFEPRFGYDFSRIRIHANGVAASAAHSLRANAFALGSDIVFGSGRFQPQSESGRRLLAHELAHVIQQGGGADEATLRRDGPDPPLKEAKKEDATDAVSGGLKTVADQAGKSDALKNYGLDLAKRYALPIWNGMTTGEKIGAVGTAASIYGLGVGSMASDPAGRSALSGVNLVAPIGLIPYATLTGFTFDLPKTKTDPLALRFSLKGDDLLDLAHQKLSYVPPLTLSFDFTMTVAPDGKVAMPFALANFGVLPGVNVAGGFGIASDLPTLASPPLGGPLAPYKSFPQPAQPAPPSGVAAFVTVDLLKAPILPRSVRIALGGDSGEKK